MKVLYIGGTGEISHACVERSLDLGHEVTVFNRGRSSEAVPAAVEHVAGDVRDEVAYRQLAQRGFDAVCQFLAYETTDVQRDLDLFSGHCGQYVFISSASAYRKPPPGTLVTEDMPLENPHWEYSRRKAACESLLREAVETSQIGATIVRPSHTFRTRFPSSVLDGDHLAWRILRGKPVLMHDDGTSLWTVTHSDDFARGFVPLLGNATALGRTFHITSDEAQPWNTILDTVGDVLGHEPEVCHVPSTTLVQYEPALEGSLLGDKSHPMQFDNSALRRVIGPWVCELSLRESLARASEIVKARLRNGYQPEMELDAAVDGIVAEHGMSR